MAAALAVSPTKPIVITGTDFAVSSPVLVSIVGAQDSGTIEHDFTTDIAGAFDSSGFRLFPQKSGVLRVTADDGTNVVSTSLQLFEG